MPEEKGISAPNVITPKGAVRAKMTIGKKTYDFSGESPSDVIAQATREATRQGKSFRKGGGSEAGGVDEWEILQNAS